MRVLSALDAKGRQPTVRSNCRTVSIWQCLSQRDIFGGVKYKAVSLILGAQSSQPQIPTLGGSDRSDGKMKGGNQMDIPVLDHIIIGDNRYTSFREQKFLI